MFHNVGSNVVPMLLHDFNTVITVELKIME